MTKLETKLVDYYWTIARMIDWGEHGINGFGEYKGIKICRHGDEAHQLREADKSTRFEYQPLVDLLFSIDNEL